MAPLPTYAVPTLLFLLPSLISASPIPLSEDQATDLLSSIFPQQIKRSLFPRKGGHGGGGGGGGKASGGGSGGSGGKKKGKNGAQGWTKSSKTLSIALGAGFAAVFVFIIALAFWWHCIHVPRKQKKEKKERGEKLEGCEYCAESPEGVCDGCKAGVGSEHDEDTEYKGGYSEVKYESHVKEDKGTSWSCFGDD